jgi:hypothetical protein
MLIEARHITFEQAESLIAAHGVVDVARLVSA